jgi:hypothetical protein
MECSAVFSQDRKYRYVLTRVWDKNKPMLVFVGLNPSIADETKDDPTIKKCIKFAQYWGYGGFYMLNLFAIVSTNPSVIYSAEDPIGKENDKMLAEYSSKVDKVVCAWGNNGSYQGRSKEVLDALKNKFYIKLNANGEPAHPLFLKGDLKPQKF